MKLLVIAASSLTLGAGASMAQETAYDWSGAYLGAQAGYAWGIGGTAIGNLYTDTQPNGMLGGVYAGFHHQLPNRLVLGADADFVMSNAADMKRRESIDTPGATDAANMDSQDILWTAALRARAGYAIDRWMPYLSIGGSLAKVDQLVRNFGTDHHIGATTFAGWTLGAGVEYALNNNITLRADYRHSDFGDKTIQSRDLPPINWHLKTHDIRFGIAYTF